MTEVHRNSGMVYFDFDCPGCGARGELGLDHTEGMTPFGCPDECGATFVMWKPNEKYVLRCVVQPVST